MMTTLRIGVADDERDMREYLQEVLQRLGYEVVVVAGTGRELVELCRATPPDMVITDIKMPDMDGIEASVAVNRVKQMPIILVSAHHDAELLVRSAVDHIMAYLVKPVKEADIKTAIAVALTRFRHFQAVAKEAADLRQALEDRKLIERAKGIIMRRVGVDEEEAFRRLRRLASSQNHKLVDVARGVLAAENVFHDLDAS